MSRLGDFVSQVRNFFDEVIAEMRKADWPGRRELLDSTVVVIVSVFLLSFYIGLCDKVLLTILDRFIL